MLDFIQTVENI